MSAPETIMTSDDLRPEQIRAWLKKHPDFLAENSDLLTSMVPPKHDQGAGVLDFQRFMLDRIRGDAEHLRKTQRDLIANARANMNTQGRVHSAVLFMLDARSFEQLITTITEDMAVLLDIDTICLVVESAGTTPPGMQQGGVRVIQRGSVDLWLGGKDAILIGDYQGDPELFGPAASLVRSQALCRLNIGPGAPAGMLVFGSRDPEFFHAGQATELLVFLGRVVERMVAIWLDVEKEDIED